MSTDKDRNLFYLNELSNYKVADGDKDITGWNVLDKTGKTIGKVDNLIVNKRAERVVYIDVEVNKDLIDANHKPYSESASDGLHEFLNKDGENHLIIPIGLANLNLDQKIVFTENLDYDTFAATKRMQRGTHLDRAYELAVLNSYNRSAGTTYDADEDFYNRTEFVRK